MIFGDPPEPGIESQDRTTLDDLFRKAAWRRPDAIALCDPPNRADFADGPPRRLTYAEADHMVSAIAGRLRRLGLPTDSVIGLQLPNTVEGTLALLGVLRAGMIAAPLPLLWRRSEAAAALNRVGAKLIITMRRFGTTDFCDLAMRTAADVFPVRYVCAFGPDLPDGVIPFDDLLSAAPLLDPILSIERSPNPAAHVAVVTFETTPAGLLVVGRNHFELIASGLAIQLEADIQRDATILACGANSTLAGLALGTLPWLLTGGTLALHQTLDPLLLDQQCRRDDCDTVVLPGALLASLMQAQLLDHPKLRTVLAVWPASERTPATESWTHSSASVTDVRVFGEVALIAARRDASGMVAAIPLGPVGVPHAAADTTIVAESAVTEAGTLAFRGPMVPRHAFPPGSERAPWPCLTPDGEGFVDTFYPCRGDDDTCTVAVTGPPPGIVTVGSYRFVLDQLQTLVRGIEGGAALTALPDALTGSRLAGTAADRASMTRALAERGVNPLVGAAFQERRKAG